MAQNDSVRMSAGYLHNELHIPYSYLRQSWGLSNRLVNGTKEEMAVSDSAETDRKYSRQK
jgi:hypothetical protein